MGQGGLIEEELTRSVIGAFFEVYNELGFGFAEHVHVRALSRELLSRGHRVARELDVPVDYKGEFLCTQRIDVVVDNTLIVETKSTEALPPTPMRQLQNYLRCTDIEIGLLLHFGPEPKFYRRFLPNSQKKSKNKNQITALKNDMERMKRIQTG